MNHKAKIYEVRNLRSYLRGVKVTRFFGELFTAKQYHPPGIDSSPAEGARPLIEAIGGDQGSMVVSMFVDQVAKTVGRGEIRVYATKDGKEIASYILCKADGTIEMNGSEYGGLIKIEALTEKVNELVAIFNAHTNGGVPVNSGAMPLLVQSDFENKGISHG